MKHNRKISKAKKVIFIISSIIIVIIAFCFIMYFIMAPRIRSFTKLENGFNESGLSWGMSMIEAKKVTKLETHNDELVGPVIAFDRLWYARLTFIDDKLTRMNLSLSTAETQTFSYYLGYKDDYIRPKAVNVITRFIEQYDTNNTLHEDNGFLIIVKEDYSIIIKDYANSLYNEKYAQIRLNGYGESLYIEFQPDALISD